MSYVAGVAQVGIVMLGAPLVIGLMRQVRARAEGRAGGGVLQPWRDLRKQLGKQSIRPHGTTVVFTAAPAIVAGSALLIAATIPSRRPVHRSTRPPICSPSSVCCSSGTVALVLAGIDTGTSFGGMGASREITIAALVEPTILLAVFALSIPAGSANLGALVVNTHAPPRAGGLAGRCAGLRRAGDRDHRRDRAAARGQPRHPSGADDGARGDGPRVRRPSPGARRMGGRDAADGSAGAAGEPVRAVGNCRRPSSAGGCA